MAAQCDVFDYVGEHGELDSDKLASPELKTVPLPMDEEASTMNVTFLASE